MLSIPRSSNYVFHWRYTYRMRMRGYYVKRLRGMCTLCPLGDIEGSIGGMNVFSCCGDWRRVCPSAELEIHVVRRRERLPTEIAEERERHACPGAVLEPRMHIQCTSHVLIRLMHRKINKSVDMSCAHKTKRNQLLQWNTNSLPGIYLATVGSLPLAKHS